MMATPAGDYMKQISWRSIKMNRPIRRAKEVGSAKSLKNWMMLKTK